MRDPNLIPSHEGETLLRYGVDQVLEALESGQRMRHLHVPVAPDSPAFKEALKWAASRARSLARFANGNVRFSIDVNANMSGEMYDGLILSDSEDKVEYVILPEGQSPEQGDYILAGHDYDEETSTPLRIFLSFPKGLEVFYDDDEDNPLGNPDSPIVSAIGFTGSGRKLEFTGDGLTVDFGRDGSNAFAQDFKPLLEMTPGDQSVGAEWVEPDANKDLGRASRAAIEEALDQ